MCAAKLGKGRRRRIFLPSFLPLRRYDRKEKQLNQLYCGTRHYIQDASSKIKRKQNLAVVVLRAGNSNTFPIKKFYFFKKGRRSSYHHQSTNMVISTMTPLPPPHSSSDFYKDEEGGEEGAKCGGEKEQIRCMDEKSPNKMHYCNNQWPKKCF